jgi:hypothetical protein
MAESKGFHGTLATVSIDDPWNLGSDQCYRRTPPTPTEDKVYKQGRSKALDCPF